ncbi:amidohydrolase family protein [Streptomyces sp. NPDC057582]|uniref:amidohydrolase family protein n=1 Tax=Streptomyces sp. NPDC057582 TaxID=3346174 RepID=UPI0036C8176C
MERLTGTVRPGPAADLIVLDRDVTKCPVADISDTRIELTLMGGRVVHGVHSSAVRAAVARLDGTAASPLPAAYAAVHGGRHGACGYGGDRP